MKTKSKIITTIALIVIVIAVILNIVLLCTDVFQGKYKCSDDKYDYEITFFDNTYSENTYIKFNQSSLSGSFRAGDLVSSDFGFYQYIPQSKYSEAEYNTLILSSRKGTSHGSSKYKRNSVFSFTYAPDSKNTTTYTCYTAIFLQVLYGVLILASIAVIVIYRPRKN